MSYFIDRISYFAQNREKFSNGHGVTTEENRAWEKAYRIAGRMTRLFALRMV